MTEKIVLRPEDETYREIYCTAPDEDGEVGLYLGGGKRDVIQGTIGRAILLTEEHIMDIDWAALVDVAQAVIAKDMNMRLLSEDD